MHRCFRMIILYAINLIASGCLVTTGGDSDPGNGIAINGLAIRTTCAASIDCAPRLVFEWCASPNRHLHDSESFVDDFWAESCGNSPLVGRIDCDAGGIPCSHRGLVEIIEPK